MKANAVWQDWKPEKILIELRTGTTKNPEKTSR